MCMQNVYASHLKWLWNWEEEYLPLMKTFLSFAQTSCTCCRSDCNQIQIFLVFLFQCWSFLVLNAPWRQSAQSLSTIHIQSMQIHICLWSKQKTRKKKHFMFCILISHLEFRRESEWVWILFTLWRWKVQCNWLNAIIRTKAPCIKEK